MISIIIPVYNVGEYLNECIESALKLKTNKEIILVDDGSTDGSGEICDRWAEKEQVKVIHQENKGLSVARNTGIRNSGGEYVMFLDSDDFLDAKITDQMLGKLESKIDVLVGLYQRYYAEENRYVKESCDAFLTMNGIVPIDQFLKKMPVDGRSCFMIACRFIVRREFLKQHNLMFFPGIYHEDEEWTQRLLCCAEHIFVTHDFFYQYRQGRSNAITAYVKPKHIFDIFIILEHSEALLKAQKDSLEKKTYLRYRMASLYLNNMIQLFSLKRDERRSATEKLMYFHDQCAEYMCGKIGNIAKICDKLFGVKIACFILAIARRLKKGKRK